MGLDVLCITENGTIEVISKQISAITHAATDVLYVSKNGGNEDGKTWERAFTTVEAAIAYAKSDLGEMTLIVIATGTYDINTSGILEIDKNIILMATSEFSVEIQNLHASATGIFKVTQETIFLNISFEVNNITAIEFSGINTGGSRLDNVIISSLYSSSPHTLIRFTNTAESVLAKNIMLIGNTTHTTAVDMEGSNSSNIWKEIQIFFCVLGIHIQTGCLLNEFSDIFMYSCTDAIIIDSGASTTIIDDIQLKNCTTEITDNGTGTTVNRDMEIDSVAGLDGYSAVLYVSADGDDSDGKSWGSAYNELWTAITQASTSASAMTEIMCASGTYDVNQTGDPTVAKNLHIKGVGGDYSVGVTIKNDHAGATSVLKFTKVAGLFALAIDCGTSNNGVIFSGAGAVNGKLIKIDFVMNALTSAKVGLLYENCMFHLNEQVYFIGNPTYATGLVFNNCQYYIDWEDLFLDCYLGISSTHASDDYMVLNNAHIHGCATGVDLIAACNDFVLNSPVFSKNTVNFTAIPTADYLLTKVSLDKEIINLFPITASGGVTVTGAGIDTYGAYIAVVAANDIPKPYKIVGLGLNGASDINAYYHIQVSYGPTDIIIGTLGFSGASKLVSVPPFNSGVIPENSQIRCRIQTSNGGNDTVDVWINYIPI